jgi:Protein ENHANCED DISEASE RESISTANCE 2, C-terminal
VPCNALLCNAFLVLQAGVPSFISSYNSKPVLVTKSGTLSRGSFEAVTIAAHCHQQLQQQQQQAVTATTDSASYCSSSTTTTSSSSASSSYLEMDCDVRAWCYLAKKALYYLYPRFSKTSLSVAFVLEGREDSELPEQLLGCCTLTNLDPSKAVPIDTLL